MRASSMNVLSVISVKRKLLYKVALIFCWVPFVTLGRYGQPFLDDYWNGSLGRDLGFINACVYQFNNWSGRFFTNALLIGLNPLSYGWLAGIKLVGPISSLLKFGGLFWAVRLLSARRLSVSNAAWIAASLLLFYYAVIPDKYASIYSFTYWVVYQVPCLLMLVVPLAVIEYQRRQNGPVRLVYLTMAALGSICTAASNEISFLLLGWVLTVCAVISIYRRQWANAHTWIFLGILLGITGFVSIILAPGNHSRMQAEFYTSTSYSPIVLLPRIVKAFKYIITDTGTLVIFAVPLLFHTLGKKLITVRPAGLHLPFGVGLLLVFTGLILGALPYNIVGYPELERPVNVLYWWLLISWIMVCWASLPIADNRSSLPRSVIMFTALAVTCVLVPSISRAWLELIIDAPTYQHQYDERYRVFKKAVERSQKTVTVNPIERVTPRYILIRDEVGLNSLYDVQINSSDISNIRVAHWFGLDSVKMNTGKITAVR